MTRPNWGGALPPRPRRASPGRLLQTNFVWVAVKSATLVSPRASLFRSQLNRCPRACAIPPAVTSCLAEHVAAHRALHTSLGSVQGRQTGPRSIAAVLRHGRIHLLVAATGLGTSCLIVSRMKFRQWNTSRPSRTMGTAAAMVMRRRKCRLLATCSRPRWNCRTLMGRRQRATLSRQTSRVDPAARQCGSMSSSEGSFMKHHLDRRRAGLLVRRRRRRMRPGLNRRRPRSGIRRSHRCMHAGLPCV